MTNQVKNEVELDRIRTSGKMLAHVLRYLTPMTVAGVTTRELDHIAADELKRLGGQPAFLGYEGYPAVICISVNDEIVHAIPGERKIKNGDIVGLDFGVNFEGMITDGAVTVPVDDVSQEARRLLRATREALYCGIDQVRVDGRIGDISHAIEQRLRADRLSVIEELGGHGVGHKLHEDPIILNYGRSGTGMRLKAGMTIAIEPMATLGRKEIFIADDGWTILTRDGGLSAQFEHTVLVTDDGFEILTD